MEKVTIKSAVNSGKVAKNGNPIIDIVLEDGRSGAGFDIKFMELENESVELDVKPGKEYGGKMQYYFSLPKSESAGGGGKKFPQKDWNFEKRKHALHMAVEMSEKDEKISTVLGKADEFLVWLNK